MTSQSSPNSPDLDWAIVLVKVGLAPAVFRFPDEGAALLFGLFDLTETVVEMAEGAYVGCTAVTLPYIHGNHDDLLRAVGVAQMTVLKPINN